MSRFAETGGKGRAQPSYVEMKRSGQFDMHRGTCKMLRVSPGQDTSVAEGPPYTGDQHALTREVPTIESDGFEIRAAAVTSEAIAAIAAELSVNQETLRRTGVRNLEKKVGSIARIAGAPALLSIVTAAIGGTPRLVRGMFFDKTAEQNWFVGWHQDRTVALSHRVDLPGWGPWTRKDGVDHVQPPADVLGRMLTIRVHVDDADEEAGCLRVIPGSHRLGILAREDIARTVVGATTRACVVRAGDALIMRPLLLHSSLKSRRSSHRRVVHLEYSGYDLPSGLSWA